MKNAQNRTVHQQAEAGKSAGGSQNTVSKNPLMVALETVKTEVARLNTEIALEQNKQKKAKLVEELTALMGSIGMSYDGAFEQPINVKPEAAKAGDDTSTAEASAKDDKKDSVFARSWTWVKGNKAKTAAIVAAAAAVVAGVVYATRSGNGEKVGESVDVLVQKFSEATADMAGEAVAGPSIWAKTGDAVVSGWNHVVTYAVKGKDAIVGIFSKSPAATDDVVQAGFRAFA